MTIRRTLLAPVSLALALMTTQAVAKIHPAAFKGVSKHFMVSDNKKIDNTMYSPTFGIVALDTGLVENIRLYGNYEPGYYTKKDCEKNKDLAEGARKYIGDTSDDPLWNVVNILFPTNTGVLSAQTNAISSFGKYVTDPKTVALLVNFAKKIYDSGKDMTDKEIILFGKTVIETLNGAKDLDKRDRTALRKNVNNLLRGIQSAIKAEKEQSSLYPKYTTVQMIQAFFCYKFSTKDNIAEELKYLDTSIVDGKALDTDLLEEKDLKEIISKKTLDVDDLFDLTQANLFTSLIPYKEGIAPLENGSTYYYNRGANGGKVGYDEEHTFTDCAEVAMRHLCNLLFFNTKDRAFNVKDIKNEDLQAFYAKQTPLLANAGDIDMRSLWNSVVGDLNTKDDTDPIAYNQTNNEVDTGFGNMIKVLSKVLGITFDKTFGAIPSDTLKDKTTWLQTSLEKLLEIMNPSYMYKVKLTDLEDYNKDIVGKASITVKEKKEVTEDVEEKGGIKKVTTFKAGENLFSFTLMQSKSHAGIEHLKNHALETKTEEINKALSNGASSSSRAPWRNLSCS